jgi:hypothetical protein
MTETRYPAGKRPRIRVTTQGGLTNTLPNLVLTKINSKSAYFRSSHVVGEMAVSIVDDGYRVEIIRHADGTPVLETEQWPPLTPYDTGERLEPAVWVLPDRRRPEEHDPDRYGRVDFNNDENATDVTVWVSRVDGVLTVHIDGHSQIDVVQVNAMDNVEDPIVEIN